MDETRYQHKYAGDERKYIRTKGSVIKPKCHTMELWKNFTSVRSFQITIYILQKDLRKRDEKTELLSGCCTFSGYICDNIHYLKRSVYKPKGHKFCYKKYVSIFSFSII